MCKSINQIHEQCVSSIYYQNWKRREQQDKGIFMYGITKEIERMWILNERIVRKGIFGKGIVRNGEIIKK